MSRILEKIIIYVLGGTGGMAIGLILVSFRIPYIESIGGEVTLVIAALCGVIFALGVAEYKKEKHFLANKKVWDEGVVLITHEMRTGLTSTGWAIELVLENYKDAISESDKKMLNGIVASINATIMHSINLLDISLLDIGKLSISLEWVSLDVIKKTLEEITVKYSIGAKRSGILLTTNIDLDTKREMEVDLMRLRIILENLMENAIQYVTGEKKEISVSVWNDDSALHMSVKDSGIGIPAEEQSKIFSEFFRASNARKKLSSGSGIGLHMSMQYAKAHNGTIHFESKENEGSTFHVTIPLKTSVDTKEFLKKM